MEGELFRLGNSTWYKGKMLFLLYDRIQEINVVKVATE